MTAQKRGYSTAEAAAYIGRSESFLRKLKRDNKIVAHRASDNPRETVTYLREDLDAYLDTLVEA